MNRLFAPATLFLALTPSAHAARDQSDPEFHIAFNLGITAGGDSIAKAKYTNGDSASIHGGGLVQLGAGIYYHKPSVPVSALLTINYHVDNATAKNGNMQFDRWPLELIGYYHLNDSWRLGAGIRHVMNAKLKYDIDNDPVTTIDYADTNSPVFEAAWGQEWRRNNFWVGLRYVHETLKARRVNDGYLSYNVDHTDDGSHVGLFLRYAF